MTQHIEFPWGITNTGDLLDPFPLYLETGVTRLEDGCLPVSAQAGAGAGAGGCGV